MKDEDLIRNINPFGLRMQPSLKAMVEEAAKQNHRSLNAEIVARLEESFSPTINPDAPMVIKRKVDGPLVSETTSVLPSPSELMRVIGEMAESLRKMAAQLKELKEDRDR